MPTLRPVHLLLWFALATPLGAQATRTLATESDLTKDPGGIPLLHLAKGTPVVVGQPHTGWMVATVEGWIAENALRADKRDGFDMSVSPSAGTPLRSAPNGGTVLATARLGALFDRIEARNGWVHVKRTGYISQAAFVATPATVAAHPPASLAAAPKPAPATAPAAPTTDISAGTTISAQAGGAPVGTLESAVHADVLEHRGGWAHVKLDVWVRDASLSGSAANANGITGTDIRTAPEKYVGQTVEWTIEVLGIEKADELRPELPLGQPYVLARGPLPETGFVYVLISKDEADTFRRLEPLARVKIRATIKAGRSRFLPTPVLTLVRLLDQGAT